MNSYTAVPSEGSSVTDQEFSLTQLFHPKALHLSTLNTVKHFLSATQDRDESAWSVTEEPSSGTAVFISASYMF